MGLAGYTQSSETGELNQRRLFGDPAGQLNKARIRKQPTIKYEAFVAKSQYKHFLNLGQKDVPDGRPPKVWSEVPRTIEVA